VRYPAVAALVWLGLAIPAHAQVGSTREGPIPPARTREISGGITFGSGVDFGESAAELTPNTGSGTSELFTTESRVRGALGAQIRLGLYVTPTIAVEGDFRYSRPVFEVRLSDDFENAEDTTAEENMNQYLVGGAVVFHFRNLVFGSGRAIPFVSGGVAYLRELHEGNELVEDGWEYQAAGGMKWWFGSSRRVGFRGEGGIAIRDGGFDFENGARAMPFASASLMWLF
jgi:hypothetical protein